MKSFPLFLPVALLSGVAALILSAPHADASARRGRALVEKNCAACHAVGAKGASKHAKAPPFREIVKKYPLESLEEAFAEGIVVSHDAPDMPAFEMEPQQIADLIDHLKTLRPRK